MYFCFKQSLLSCDFVIIYLYRLSKLEELSFLFRIVRLKIKRDAERFHLILYQGKIALLIFAKAYIQ